MILVGVRVSELGSLLKTSSKEPGSSYVESDLMLKAIFQPVQDLGFAFWLTTNVTYCLDTQFYWNVCLEVFRIVLFGQVFVAASTSSSSSQLIRFCSSILTESLPKLGNGSLLYPYRFMRPNLRCLNCVDLQTQSTAPSRISYP
jgi:hypothetical protein